jgi:hypothetical protein
MEEEIVNRIQNSSLVTLDLEEFYVPGERIFFDLKPFLYQEIILKEKDFRATLKATDWSRFMNKHVAIGCTADAIVPTWAYMLLTISLKPFAETIVFGSLADLEKHLFRNAIDKIKWENYTSAKVVVKGCSKIEVPTEIYIEVAARLNDVAASIMYGEACSTVPLYKRPK